MERRSEQLEQEAEDARAQLADTIEELRHRVSDLRHRLSPSNFLSSPIPLSLIGAGAAWFVLRRMFGASREASEPSSEMFERIAKRANGSERTRTPRLQSILMTGAGVAAAAAIASLLPKADEVSSRASESAGSKVNPDLAAASPTEWRASRLTGPGDGRPASRWQG